MSDVELLQAYVRDRSETAFATLVERHVNLVYSAARRQVRSLDLAEDVAQAVFVELSRHAARIPSAQPLAAWLYVVTRRTAIDAIRRESRRLARETTAAEIAAMKTPSETWSKVEASVDEAMATLSETERSALVLRFFQNLSFREVGASLGISEDTAQKRVSRAVEQLRSFYAGRGVAVSGASFAVGLSTHAVQAAPTGLAAAISSATAALPAAAAGATKQIAMTTAQKTLATLAVAAALTAGVYQTVTVRRQAGQIVQLQNLSATWQREIQRLDRQRALAASRPAQATATPAIAAASDDNGFDTRLRALVENVNRLKKYLKQHPAEQIPEIRSLSDQTWFELAQRYPNLGTDADYRPALAALRNSAKSEFLHAAERALEKYLESSQGILPSEVAQLASHFEAPIDDAIFQRYEMTATGRASGLSKVAMILRETASLAIDPARDNQAGLTGHGVAMGAFPNATTPLPAGFESAAQQKSVDEAIRAFADAHGGNSPAIDELDTLLPYFSNPAEGARWIQHMKGAQSQTMPGALNQAWNDARRAYAITHHGAEPIDQLELASYFQHPMDGARYLDFISRRAGLK